MRCLHDLRTWVLALCVLWPGLALGHPLVDAGRTALSQGNPRAALARLEEAERSPALTEDELVEVQWLRVVAFHALGNVPERNRAVMALLKLRPLYVPNKYEAPPDLRAAFKQLADEWQAKNGVTIKPPGFNGASLVVPLGGNLSLASDVKVFARVAGDTTYNAFILPVSGEQASGKLSDLDLWERVGDDGILELAIEVANRRGIPVARSGDAVQPIRLRVPKETRAIALAELGRTAPVVEARATPPKDPPAPAVAPTENPAPQETPVAKPRKKKRRADDEIEPVEARGGSGTHDAALLTSKISGAIGGVGLGVGALAVASLGALTGVGLVSTFVFDTVVGADKWPNADWLWLGPYLTYTFGPLLCAGPCLLLSVVTALALATAAVSALVAWWTDA